MTSGPVCRACGLNVCYFHWQQAVCFSMELGEIEDLSLELQQVS